MYKFTNGMVFFDEESKNKALDAGYKLVENVFKESVEGNREKFFVGMNEDIIANGVENENQSDNGAITEKPKRSKKTTSRHS